MKNELEEVKSEAEVKVEGEFEAVEAEEVHKINNYGKPRLIFKVLADWFMPALMVCKNVHTNL